VHANDLEKGSQRFFSFRLHNFSKDPRDVVFYNAVMGLVFS
jgi:hypothetical protein